MLSQAKGSFFQKVHTMHLSNHQNKYSKSRSLLFDERNDLANLCKYLCKCELLYTVFPWIVVVARTILFFGLWVRHLFEGDNYSREETIVFLFFVSINNLNCCRMLKHSGKVNLKVKLIESRFDSFTNVKDTIIYFKNLHSDFATALLMYLLTYYLSTYFVSLKFKLVLKGI